jgi:hypothetical protein
LGFRQGFDVITMKEFLEREAMTGNLRDRSSGQATYPPLNRTDWDGLSEVAPVFEWLRNASVTPMWSAECVVPFPARRRGGRNQGGGREPEDGEAWVRQLQRQLDTTSEQQEQEWLANPAPPPADADPWTRMTQILAGRRKLCPYGDELRQERVVHVVRDEDADRRLLVHFYAFLLFQDWREELRTKRFIRDRVRYGDEIQCAAARIVAELRDHVRRKSGSTPGGGGGGGSASGAFDTMHVRRDDFTKLPGYSAVTGNASDLVKDVQDILVPGSTVYIATDEANKTYFEPFKQVYDVKFLDGT